MTTSKIFFHGPGPGVGDFVRGCATRGITGTWKSVDSAGWIAEVCEVAVNSGIMQHAIMRWTEPGGITDGAGDFYQKSPEDSANEYFWRVMGEWEQAPELHQYKDLLWLEIGNELRTQYDHDSPNYQNMHPADWLGWWGFYIAELFNQAGFNVLLFGMNAGTPEAEDWLLPGMRAFLELAESVAPQIGISVHEGMGKLDWRTSRPADNVPFINGRLTYITDACDFLGINTPPIFVTEWAWSYDHMPPQDRALEDVEWMAGFYDSDPAVEGVCLWNLDRRSSDGTVASQMTAFLPVLEEFTYWWDGPGPVEPPPEETFEQFIWRVGLDSQTIELNADAAIQKVIFEHGYMPVGPETWAGYDQVGWAIQGAEHLAPGHPRRTYYVLVGDWGNVRWIEDPEEPPPSEDPLEGLELGPLFFVPHVITSRFNDPRSYGPHEGIDLDIFTAENDSKEPVRCGYDGVVHAVGRQDTGYAKYVVVSHTYNGVDFKTWYAHMDATYVTVGDRVSKGHPLGELGATGNTGTPPREHVHFNLQVPGRGLDGYYIEDVVDPEPYMVFIVPPVDQTPALLGLHAPSDIAGRWFPDDFTQFTNAKVEAIKVQSAHSPEDIAKVRNDNPGVQIWVVRAFLEFGGRAVTPQQFYDWTIDDVERTINAIGDGAVVYIEMHNEPNLQVEGYGTAWSSGAQFAVWLAEVIALFKQRLPNARYLYPGLSPSGDGGPTAREFFWGAPGLDGIGVHAYWGVTNGLLGAVDEVAHFAAFGKPVIVTESSNKGDFSSVVKGADYIEFAKLIGDYALAVTYFVCSARLTPEFAKESWVGTNISQIVGSR